ncbi:MAG TPA: CoA transferase [Pseudolysinimonas sp.]
MTGAPLAGMRVLDFCWIGAGALVTKTLAELGASVYRIESRSHPDNLRLAPPFRPGTEGLEASGYFASRNSSKQSIALNMKTERGRRLAAELVGKVDIVTSNFRPGIMERWGLGYDEVVKLNPSVIYLTMPMQGETGPHAGYVGFGSTIAALAGLVDLSAVPGRSPVGTGTHYPDHVPNPGHALVAVLAAVRHRRRTGEGQRIELAQFESTVNVIGPAVVAAGLGTAPTASGNRTRAAAPHAAFRCRDDQWIVLSCNTDEQWSALEGTLGLTPDPARATLSGRKADEDALEDDLQAAVGRLDRPEVIALLTEAEVPVAPVNSSRDIVEEPGLWARGYWRDIQHPVIGSIPISRSPFRLVDGPQPDLVRPPLLGEHTFEVLHDELGMTQEEYERLVGEQVLY